MFLEQRSEGFPIASICKPACCAWCNKQLSDDKGNITCYTIQHYWVFCSLECHKAWIQIFENYKAWQAAQDAYDLMMLMEGRSVHLPDKEVWPKCEVCGGDLTICRDGWGCGYCQTKENIKEERLQQAKENMGGVAF
jgi:hypothetical protein